MKVYNSLTFKKEEFNSINPDEVLMYVCGPTVYDSPHLGHAKSAVAFDIIRRFLTYKGYAVKLVKNYTDIDDKIIKRANERGMDYQELSEKYIQEYEGVMDLLNVQKDYKNPRATEIIDFMIKIIETLVEKGHAYEENGSVYFSVRTFPNYNYIFQNVTPEEQEEEEQEEFEEEDVAYGMEKHFRKDFVLWKKKKEGEPAWESPWGEGRPGWHIECSAMALKFLGDTIDIHAGGKDLKSPHHRNEIAQSEAYTRQKFANYFLHNGFVNVDNEKMSKSLGNFFLVSEVVKDYDPMVVRLFLISSHYRSSINFSQENMQQAQKNYKKMLNTIRKIGEITATEEKSEDADKLLSILENSKKSIIGALEDDFDTPVALAEILTTFRDINRLIFEENIVISPQFKEQFFSFIDFLDQLLGIFPNLEKRIHNVPVDKPSKKDELIKELVNLIQNTREKLREKRLFELSDEIREKLRELGIPIEDSGL